MVKKEIYNPSVHKVILVSGIQWGDECKGKLVASLSRNVDIVAKYNGGHNAGHEFVAGGLTHKLHVLPCGSIHPWITNVLGNGVVIHLGNLLNEIENLRKNGIDIIDRLLISDRSHLVLDIHLKMDSELELDRNVTGRSIGTTLRGIGPCYTTKSSRTGVLVGDMLHWESFSRKIHDIFRIHIKDGSCEEKAEEELKRHKEYFRILSGCIIDTSIYMSEMIAAGKHILLEGAHGSMLDLNMGTYPFVTSSTTLACGAFIGLGIPPDVPIYRIGVLKSYQTRVGKGPFPTECLGEMFDHIQKHGVEVGITTSRVRRCGWLDLAAARYAHRLNSLNTINLTKLDVLSGLKSIKVCVDYRYVATGEIMKRGTFPATVELLDETEPVYQTFDGWDEDISRIRDYDSLPLNARRYVEFIEEELGVYIQWIGVGKDVENTIHRS